jgi:uncharacterized protein YbcI
MEQKKTIFPDYYPGQLLTSDNLNNSFSYLEEQDRLSRANLAGYGIVNGLITQLASDSIKISAGTAFTSDGFSFSFSDFKAACMVKYDPANEKIAFSKKSKEDDLSFLDGAYLLFQSAKEVEALECDIVMHNIKQIGTTKKPVDLTKVELHPNDYPHQYVVGVVVDFKTEKILSCNQQTCNAVISQTQIIGRPVLILKEKLKEKQTKVTFSKQKPVAINRLRNVFEFRDHNLLQDKISSVFMSNKDSIRKAMETLLSSMSDIGKKVCETLFTPNEINRFKNALDRVSFFNVSYIRPYTLLFLEDVLKALNEYIVFYNRYVDKYLHFTGNVQYDRLIVLTQGEYRNLFVPAFPNPEQMEDKATLTKLFRRIAEMILSYIDKNNWSTESLNLIPVLRNAQLGQSPIPYYYNKTAALREVWGVTFSGLYPALDPPNTLDKVNDFYSRPLFRVEGCDDKDVDTVYSQLAGKVFLNGLPVQIEKFELLKPRNFRKNAKNKLLSVFKRSNGLATTLDNEIKKAREEMIKQLISKQIKRMQESFNGIVVKELKSLLNLPDKKKIIGADEHNILISKFRNDLENILNTAKRQDNLLNLSTEKVLDIFSNINLAVKNIYPQLPDSVKDRVWQTKLKDQIDTALAEEIKVVRLELTSSLNTIWQAKPSDPILGELNDTIKKFQQYRNIYNLMKEISSVPFEQYYDEIREHFFFPTDKLEFLNDKLDLLMKDKESLGEYLKQYIPTETAKNVKLYKDDIYGTLFRLYYNVKKTYVQHRVGSEFVSGVYADNVLVLLYFNKKIFMTVNMSGHIEKNPEKYPK